MRVQEEGHSVTRYQFVRMGRVGLAEDEHRVAAMLNLQAIQGWKVVSHTSDPFGYSFVLSREDGL